MRGIPSRSPIVVLDDHEADRFVLGLVLGRSRLDNPVIEFETGSELLAHLERVKRGLEAVPALLLLDVNLPGMDGFAVLERIRSEAMFGRAPQIAMLTSSDAPGDMEHAAALGADCYICKQSGFEAFVTLIDATFSNSPTVEGAEHSPR